MGLTRPTTQLVVSRRRDWLSGCGPDCVETGAPLESVLLPSGSNSAGRVSASQAECRGFESVSGYRDLLRDAAEALGTTRTTDTVHAALRDVVARRRRAWLARRDFSELEAALPDLRTSRVEAVERPGERGAS